MANNKILITGYSNSIHFWRWAHFLKKANFKINILSFVKNEIKFDKIYEKYLDYSVKKKGLIKFLKLIINIFKSIYYINKSNNNYVNLCFLESYLAFIALFIKKKIIITCWGSDILLNYKKSNFIKKYLFDKAFNKASYITCDSDSIKSLIIEKCKRIEKDKINKIYWGINISLFSIPSYKEKNKLRKKYNIPQNAIVLLSIRNLTRQYRILEIIKCFNKNISDKNIFLFIKIPSEIDKNYINECIKEANKNKNIIINKEKIDYKNIREIYKISDISLHFPDSDSTPVSMLESISSGNLIICSDKIDSYKKLSEYYKLFLIDLNELNNDFINKILKGKNKIITDNKIKLNKLHDEKLTINNIRVMFGK